MPERTARHRVEKQRFTRNDGPASKLLKPAENRSTVAEQRNLEQGSPMGLRRIPRERVKAAAAVVAVLAVRRVLPVAMAAVLLPAFVSATQFVAGAPQRANLSPPAGARIVSFDNYGFGIVAEFHTREMSATGGHVRLETTVPAAVVVDHYVAQLSALGWRTTMRQVDPTFGLVRFAVGRDDDPVTGILTVMPFASTGHTIVAVRLVRSRMPWISSGRGGGGGANDRGGAPPASFLLYASQPRLTLPDAVLRAQRRDGGGQPDIQYAGARIETFMSVQALWDSLAPQFPNANWTTTARLGDPVQSAVRRTSPDGHLSEILIITGLPAAREVDVAHLIACSSERPCADWWR
jgi:hypothetical protein